MSELSSRFSVTEWIEQTRQNKEEGASQLYQRYFDLLLPVARRRLENLRLSDDAQVRDAVDSALRVCIRKLRGGAYPRLHDRKSLWPLLITITQHKANDLWKRETATKRGGGKVLGEQVLERKGDSSPGGGLDDLPAGKPTPFEEVAWKEICELFLNQFTDSRYLEVVLLRLQGSTIPEIVTETGHSKASVDRWLAHARTVLKRIVGDSIP